MIIENDIHLAFTLATFLEKGQILVSFPPKNDLGTISTIQMNAGSQVSLW